MQKDRKGQNIDNKFADTTYLQNQRDTKYNKTETVEQTQSRRITKKQFMTGVAGALCLVLGCFLLCFTANPKTSNTQRENRFGADQTLTSLTVETAPVLLYNVNDEGNGLASEPILCATVESAFEQANGNATVAAKIVVKQACTVSTPIVVSGKNIELTAPSNRVITNAVTDQSMIQLGAGAALTISGEVEIDGGKDIAKDQANGVPAPMISVGTTKSTSSNKATLVIADNAKIENYVCTATDTAGAIFVGNYCSLTMTSGTICKNYTKGFGGAVCVYNNGKFTMQKGTLSGNVAEKNGGAVCVNASGKFICKDADTTGSEEDRKLTGNTSYGNGSAVFVAAKAEMEMVNSTVSKNTAGKTAATGCGAIAVLGYAKLNGGTITENTAYQGAGIFIDGGSVNLADTKITKNESVMTDGKYNAGAGIYDNGNLAISGKPVIKDNSIKANGEYVKLTNNVYLNSTHTMNLSGDLQEGASIGVTTAQSGVGDVASGASDYAAAASYFSSDAGSYGIGIRSGKVFVGYHIVFDKNDGDAKFTDGKSLHDMVLPANTSLQASELPQVTCDGKFLNQTSNYGWYVLDKNNNKKMIDVNTKFAEYNLQNGEITVYASWNKLIATLERNGLEVGKYSQLKDAILATKDGDKVVLQSDCEVNAMLKLTTRISLVSATGKQYTIRKSNDFGGQVLTILDQTTQSSNRKGVLSLENVVFDGNSKASSLISVDGGELEIRDGVVLKGMQFGSASPSASTGYGALYVASGQVTMSGGTITNNSMNGYGGGVYLVDGTFTMTGGKITGNTSQSGSGVYVKGGNFTMTGGSITGNHGTTLAAKGIGICANVDISFGGSAKVTDNEGSNIYLRTGKNLKITQAFDGAMAGITMETPTDGFFTKGLSSNGTEASFTSDSVSYGVGLEEGEAYLGYMVNFDAQGGYFKEDEEKEEQPVSRTVVVLPGHTVIAPVVYKKGSGFMYWSYLEAGRYKKFDENTVVDGDMNVMANWGDGNVRVNSHTYYSLDYAVQDAQEGDTITVVNSVLVSEPIKITKSVTITGEQIRKGFTGVLFTVSQPGEEEVCVSFKNISIFGHSYAGSLVQADSGTVFLDSGCILEDAAEGENLQTAETTGLGTVYVNGGNVIMKSTASIRNNVCFGKGAGVYVADGTFEMHGGEIKNNIARYEGGGIYIAPDGAAYISGGNIFGNIAGVNAPYGSGVYNAGTLVFGNKDTTSTIQISDNWNDNIYVKSPAKIKFAGKLSEDSVVKVTLEKPEQGVFTEGLLGNAKLETNLQTENEGYTVATDAEGEAYLGYAVTFVLPEGYFADEVALGEGERHTQRTVVYVKNTNPVLPEVRNGTLALDGWYEEDSTKFDETSLVTKDLTVTARYSGAVCHIEDKYFSTLESAVKEANQTETEATIQLLANTPISATLDITSPITLCSEGSNSYRVTRASALVMAKVKAKGKLTLENVTLNGNEKSYNIIYIDGGAVTVTDGATITGCANAVRSRSAQDISGPGTIYLANGNLTMTGGTIKGNHPYRGGGVYVDGGQFAMSGGSICNNQLSEDASIYGGGVYLASQHMTVSGSAVIKDNKLNSGTEQNVYFETDSGFLKIGGELKEEASIGVTPSVGPKGITSDQMVNVTDTVNMLYLASYPENAVFSDNPSYETVIDSDLNQIRLRKGHTVTFDAGEGTLTGSRTIDVVDGACLTTIPSASKTGCYFAGWYDDDENKITKLTPITKSMTVKALYTEGKCEIAKATPASSTVYGTDVQVELTSATEGANIYYTTDGSEPTTQSQLYTNPLSFTEDVELRTIAVKDGWTNSDINIEQYRIVNVQKMGWITKPEAVYRGYDMAFAAEVKTGNTSTSKKVTWKLVGDYEYHTSISETGVLTVDANETADSIIVQAVSEDPAKYLQAEVPVKNQYTVRYDKNAPTGASVSGMVEDAKSPYEEGSTVTVLPNGSEKDSLNKGYVCSGYVFKNWNSQADGSGTVYENGDTFAITKDVTLYAQWEVNIVIEKVEITPKSATVKQGEQYPFKAVITGKGNYTGKVTWSISGAEKEGTTISEDGVLSVDENETAPTVNVTVISDENENCHNKISVTIKKLERFALVYSSTGGTGDMTQQNQNVVKDTKVKIAECAYEKNGYNFVSWNTKANGKGYELKPGDYYNMAQDTTLYAQWVRNGTYVEPEDSITEKEEETNVVVKTDKEYAEETIALIDAIGTVTAKSGDKIEAARQSYNALTPAQKALIDETEYQKLTLREEMYDKILHPEKATSTSSSTADKNQANVSTVSIAPIPLKKGKTFKSGKYWYLVTKSTAKSRTVTMVKPVSNKITTCYVASRVKYNDVSYTITAVSKNAFANCKYLKKVTIGKQVKTIGSKAFYNTKKLHAVIIKSKKLNKISSKAFYKLESKAYLKMPDTKYRTYEKMLRKSKINKNLRLKTY